MMPACASAAIAAGGVAEGATVTRTVPQSSPVSHSMSLAAMARMKLRVVGAASLRVDERALDVNPENARAALAAGNGDCFDCGLENLFTVGDHRRQQAGRAESAMGKGNAADAVGRRLLVEESAAAAVHLRIDEARRQESALEIDLADRLRQAARRNDGLDAGVFDDDRGTGDDRSPVEDPGAGQGEPAHRVSVTFLRSRGRSGSRPRRRAMRSAEP